MGWHQMGNRTVGRALARQGAIQPNGIPPGVLANPFDQPSSQRIGNDVPRQRSQILVLAYGVVVIIRLPYRVAHRTGSTALEQSHYARQLATAKCHQPMQVIRHEHVAECLCQSFVLQSLQLTHYDARGTKVPKEWHAVLGDRRDVVGHAAGGVTACAQVGVGHGVAPLQECVGLKPDLQPDMQGIAILSYVSFFQFFA